MIAGILMGIDLFLKKEQIDRLEAWLNHNISAFFESLENLVNSEKFFRLILIILLVVTSTLAIQQKETVLEKGNLIHSLPFGPLNALDKIILQLDTLNKIILSILAIVLNVFLAHIFERIFIKLTPLLGQIIIMVLRNSFFLLTISPKGVLGSMGIILFILGNAFQLKATF